MRFLGKRKAEVHRKHFNDVVRVVTHDFYCCRLLDLSLLQLLCTGGCLGKRVKCVVERGVRWYIELLGVLEGSSEVTVGGVHP